MGSGGAGACPSPCAIILFFHTKTLDTCRVYVLCVCNEESIPKEGEVSVVFRIGGDGQDREGGRWEVYSGVGEEGFTGEDQWWRRENIASVAR